MLTLLLVWQVLITSLVGSAANLLWTILKLLMDTIEADEGFSAYLRLLFNLNGTTDVPSDVRTEYKEWYNTREDQVKRSAEPERSAAVGGLESQPISRHQSEAIMRAETAALASADADIEAGCWPCRIPATVPGQGWQGWGSGEAGLALSQQQPSATGSEAKTIPSRVDAEWVVGTQDKHRFKNLAPLQQRTLMKKVVGAFDVRDLTHLCVWWWGGVHLAQVTHVTASNTVSKAPWSVIACAGASMSTGAPQGLQLRLLHVRLPRRAGCGWYPA